MYSYLKIGLLVLLGWPSLQFPSYSEVFRYSEDYAGWSLSLGDEFPGASGSLAESGEEGLVLSGDFREGGAYVAAQLDLSYNEGESTEFIVVECRSYKCNEITLRLVDESGQTFQRSFTIKADGSTQFIRVSPKNEDWQERWGGEKSENWFGDLEYASVIIADNAWPDKLPSLTIDEVAIYSRSDLLAGALESIAFDLATGSSIQGWEVDGKPADEGPNLNQVSGLEISRSIEEPGSRVLSSPPIPLGAGTWNFSVRDSVMLDSPDDSYRRVVRLKTFSTDGAEEEEYLLSEQHGSSGLQTWSSKVELPKEAVFGRLEFSIEKAVGEVLVKNVVVTKIRDYEVGVKDIRIEAKSSNVGNLFYPGDDLEFSVKISKLPRSDFGELIAVTRDYWGSQVSASKPLEVVIAEVNGAQVATGKLVYGSSLFEIGKFYALELYVVHDGKILEQENYGFAFLPEAQSNSLSHDETQFTARNWDGRIEEYIRLARRLGIRVVNLWGGWKKKAPYDPWVSGLELAESLDLQWIVGAPTLQFEQGDNEWNSENLSGGMTEFLHAFGERNLFAVSAGNEARGTEEQVKSFVEGYRSIYEAVKQFDSEIEVIASSVEPEEDFWKHGIGKWSDSYDFHVYQGFRDVEDTYSKLVDLSSSYSQERPIRSTEIGLNSRGMPRHVVAGEIWKSISHFFAQGGTSAAWFGFLYPDPNGTEQQSSGLSHCLFGSQYNSYHPKVDAIAYYHLINLIGAKRYHSSFYDNAGNRVHQFVDSAGGSLLVAWRDVGRETLTIPLVAGENAVVWQIDGLHTEIVAGESGIQISLRDLPVLVEVPTSVDLDNITRDHWVSVVDLPEKASRGDQFTVQLECDSNEIRRVEVKVGKDWSWSSVLDDPAAYEVEILVSENEYAEVIWVELYGYDAEARNVYFDRIPIRMDDPLQIDQSTLSPGNPTDLDVR